MSAYERAKIIIETIQYMTIATVCEDGTPWNSPVATAYDEDLNFYWKSWTENQHSRNICNNKNIFIVIYDSRAKAGEGEGVYIKAHAIPLLEDEEQEIIKAYNVLKNRSGYASSSPEEFVSGVPRRIYKAVPEKIWVNDGGTKNGSFIDVRNELSLENLKKQLKS
ncbi:MAG TPA: pyridoxamine 5'-phosphate oxidase family protein [Alphaproteobacteria bacterium]|nr:pyridoxamine 5'-phosphate oxidase family protein [Alphaproteobacteria bacterium]HOO49779.1 pyridoxamine 5'-phosphate oxidase family protein [Alphaproteobacteria bacterium]